MAANAVEARVAQTIHDVEERRADHGGRCGVLTIEHLAEGIDAEVEIARAVVEREGAVGVDDVGIVGCRGDVATICCKRLLKLLLGLGRVDITDAHGVAQAQRIGIALPRSRIASKAGHVATDAVGAGTQLCHAGRQLVEEEIVDFLLRVVFWVGDALGISLAGIQTWQVAVDVGHHRHEEHTVDAQCGIGVGQIL